MSAQAWAVAWWALYGLGCVLFGMLLSLIDDRGASEEKLSTGGLVFASLVWPIPAVFFTAVLAFHIVVGVLASVANALTIRRW